MRLETREGGEKGCQVTGGGLGAGGGRARSHGALVNAPRGALAFTGLPCRGEVGGPLL